MFEKNVSVKKESVCLRRVSVKMVAEMNMFAQPCIPMFEKDYDHWSMLMENLLRLKEYWNLIEIGITEPTARIELNVA